MFLVKIAKLGSAVQEVALESGQTTVDHALKAARMSPGGDEIRVRGMTATLQTELQNGDIITLVPPVKGGL